MLHVVAFIDFEAERLNDLKEIYQNFTPRVREEPGCIQYTPTLDFDTELPNQIRDSSQITVTEIWEDYKAFQTHLKAPHVIEFRKQIQGIVKQVNVKVLQPIT